MNIKSHHVSRTGVSLIRSIATAACLVLLPLGATPAESQDAIDPTGDIVVALPQARAPIVFETRRAVEARAIDLIGANAADEILRRLPSVYVPVNSRGEAIAFVRGAAERQVAIFYDGASLNVPWDNRLDLSLLPAAFAGSAQVAAAPLAPRYGVNALGAISFAAARPGGATARIMAGSTGLREAQATVPLDWGSTDLLVGGSYATRDAEPLSSDAMLPFSQSIEERRTNTDRALGSVFARVATKIGSHRLALTAFHVDASKGIAPESDRPSGARFWRYPDVRHTLVSGDALFTLGPATALDLIGWYQRFDQTIDSYTNVSYATRDAQERNRDRTLGTRLLLTQQVGALQLVASGNLLSSVHHQRDLAFTNGAPPAVTPGFIRYRQRNASLGLDASAPLVDGLNAELGVGYDRVDYLDTGDKPTIRAAKGWTGRAGLVWSPDDAWRLRAALGRKIRAPTMRELFGQALNRFLINPDLRPERIVSAELAAEWRSDAWDLSLVGFVQDLDGTIDQRAVGRLRQRINLPGSQVLGVEAVAVWRPVPAWSLGSSATYADTRRKHVSAGQTDRLAEKPDVLARLYADYRALSGFGALAELMYTGRAYSADANGVLVALPRSTAVNLRASQRMKIAGTAIDLFVRGDNLFDALIMPQLGLPAPGRSVRLGMTIGVP